MSALPLTMQQLPRYWRTLRHLRPVQIYDGPEAARWLALGQRLLRRELNEQILADGGHFERSPMYHAILLEDVLDVLNLARVYPDALEHGLLALGHAKAVAMLDWLATMTHPDGQISFFNDAAFGIAPTASELAAYGEQLGVAAGWKNGTESSRSQAPPWECRPDAPASSATTRRWSIAISFNAGALEPERASSAAALLPSVVPTEKPQASATDGNLAGNAESTSDSYIHFTQTQSIWLRDSGYIRLQAGPAVALLDVAPIGPDYLPGHAHADTLSFELSLFGQRVIVNGGTSRYGSGPDRLAERSTAAHSTVQIDGADSSEVWGGFRVARRARPFDVVVSNDGSLIRAKVHPDAGDAAALRAESGMWSCQVSAAHDGYRRLPGRPVHRRSWCLTADGLSVIDALDGDCSEAVARFPLHPAVRVEMDQTEPGDADDCDTTLNAATHQDSVAIGALSLPGGQSVAWRVTGGQARIVPSHWHPQFGASVQSHCLEISINGREGRFELSWARCA